MARNKNDRLKRILLLSFVVLSVALIVGMYVTELTAGSEPGPAFYRDAPTLVPANDEPVTAPTREHRAPGHATVATPDSHRDPAKRTLEDE